MFPKTTATVLALLFTTAVMADTVTFYYNASGADWSTGACKGNNQSPINFGISSSGINFTSNGYKTSNNTVALPYNGGSGQPANWTAIDGLRIEYNYGNSIAPEVENLTNILEVLYNDTTGYMNVYDDSQTRQSFHALQFHFHQPSEHTFDGKNYDAEMHIVHSNADSSKLSVVSVMFDQKAGGTTDNDFIANIILNSNGTANPNSQFWVPEAADVATFLGRLDKTKIFNYEGSLTTPPCTEDVEWNVIDDPQPISTAQLAFFRNKWANNQTFAKGRGNNRLPQAINSRSIFYYGGPAASSAINTVFFGFIASLAMIVAYII